MPYDSPYQEGYPMRKYDPADMVTVTRADGSTVLVPRDVAHLEEGAGPKKRAIDIIIGPRVEELRRDFTIGRPQVTPVNRASIERMGQTVSDVADQGYEERMAREAAMKKRIAEAGQTVSDVADSAYRSQPTPFTDVRKGISEDLVQNYPSQSDILSEADLQYMDEMRRRRLGVR